MGSPACRGNGSYTLPEVSILGLPANHGSRISEIIPLDFKELNDELVVIFLLIMIGNSENYYNLLTLL